jgi:hypothetical protein
MMDAYRGNDQVLKNPFAQVVFIYRRNQDRSQCELLYDRVGQGDQNQYRADQTIPNEYAGLLAEKGTNFEPLYQRFNKNKRFFISPGAG